VSDALGIIGLVALLLGVNHIMSRLGLTA